MTPPPETKRDALMMRRNMNVRAGGRARSARRVSATSTRVSGCNVWARRSACVEDSFMTMVMSKPGAKAGVCVDVESDDRGNSDRLILERTVSRPLAVRLWL